MNPSYAHHLPSAQLIPDDAPQPTDAPQVHDVGLQGVARSASPCPDEDGHDRAGVARIALLAKQPVAASRLAE